MTSQDIALKHPEQLFHEFLASHHHPLDDVINYDSNKFHYLKCPHGSKTDARYKFYPDGIAAGYFKCWHCDIEADFSSKQQHEVTAEEWQSHKARLETNKKQNELETQKRYADVADLAKLLYANANPEQASEHGYLRLNQAKNYGLRAIINEDKTTNLAGCYKDTLLVPHYNINHELINLERIYFDKKENKYRKRPLVGGQRIGAFYLLGEVTEQTEVILLAEGYSTGAIAYEATGYPTAITFSCGNILSVTKSLRQQHPQTRLLIIADNDCWHKEVKLRDAGLKAAKKACANVINTTYILPDFDVLELSDEQLMALEPTDINDIFVHLLTKGLDRSTALDVIRQQLKFQPTPHAEVLEQLLKKVTPIDFRRIANLKEKEKIKTPHYLIITIEQILALARINNWGICKNHEFIYVYNGEYWQVIKTEELKTFLGDAAKLMGVDEFNAKYFNFREQLHKQFIELANLPKPEQQKDSVRINLKNGTFEVTPNGVTLSDFNRADFMTYQLPFEHNEHANAPLFSAYLDKVLPEPALQDILSEYLGYVFIRPATLKLEKTLLLYGTGANGKSVFYEIVRSLLGDQNTSEYSLQSLTNDTGYFRAMIANKLVNYASEINGKLEASIFKQLVSGEPVEARLPYGRPFTLTHYAKLIFNCNELPRDVEQTEAYFRRFLIVPFNVTIPEAEQDKQLSQKIIANELSGVFNWVLRGLHRLLEQKHFTESETVKLAREQYEKESDSVMLFLEEEYYQPHSTEFIVIKKLYAEYRGCCLESGVNPVKKTDFIKRLERRKIVLERKNVGKVAFLHRPSRMYKNN